MNPWKRGNRFVLFCFFGRLTKSVCLISSGLYTEDRCDFAKTETLERMDLKLLAKHSNGRTLGLALVISKNYRGRII